MAKIKDKITLVIQRIALDVKLLYDYINEQGLKGVTDISNWTDNSIKLGGSSSAKPEINIEPRGETTSNRILGEESIMLVAVDNRQGSNTIDYLEYISTNVGVIDEAAVWANAFTLGDDAGYEFGYRSNGNPITNSNPFVKINLHTFKHHSERIIGKTGYIRTQSLQFPPEDGTLATREWLIEDSDPGASVGPNPGFIVSIDGTIRHLRAGNNLNIRGVYLDAVDTKNTTGANASNSKMFLVGVLSQTTGGNGNQSYSNSKIYATNGTLTATAFNGNASSATKLNTARTINGTSFNGAANITTAQWGTARNLRVDLSKNTATSVNGSANIDNIGVKNTLPIANGGTGSTAAGTIATLRNSDTLVRAWSGKIISDYVEEKAKELINEDKRVVNAIGSYGANNDHGATIILSTSTNGIGFGTASALRDTFEVSLYNNSNGSKDILGGTGFTYQLQDGTTSSSIRIKARGIGTITRITKGSTAIMLALGDFEI